MTLATSKMTSFELLTKINEKRAAFGFGPISKYEHPVRSDLTAEYKRVVTTAETGASPW